MAVRCSAPFAAVARPAVGPSQEAAVSEAVVRLVAGYPAAVDFVAGFPVADLVAVARPVAGRMVVPLQEEVAGVAAFMAVARPAAVVDAGAVADTEAALTEGLNQLHGDGRFYRGMGIVPA